MHASCACAALLLALAPVAALAAEPPAVQAITQTFKSEARVALNVATHPFTFAGNASPSMREAQGAMDALEWIGDPVAAALKQAVGAAPDGAQDDQDSGGGSNFVLYQR